MENIIDGASTGVLRQQMLELMARTIRASGVPALITRWHRRKGFGVLIYHDPLPEHIDAHLTFLRTQGFSFVDYSETVAALTTNQWDRIPPNAVAITLDDGLSGIRELEEVFQRHNVRPTVFLCSQIVGTHRRFWFNERTGEIQRLKHVNHRARIATLRDLTGFEEQREYASEPPQALSAADVHELNQSFNFGSHTRFHPILTTCTDEEAKQEIFLSKDEVEAMTGQPCPDFAYPNGDYGEREIACVKAAGYVSARTTDVGWNRLGTDPF